MSAADWDDLLAAVWWLLKFYAVSYGGCALVQQLARSLAGWQP